MAIKKKATVKKVSTKKKLDVKKEVERMNAEQARVEKEIKEFQKRLDVFGKEIEKIAKKHNVKVLLQGYDEKSETPFVMGCSIDTDFTARAMESYMMESIARNRK